MGASLGIVEPLAADPSIVIAGRRELKTVGVPIGQLLQGVDRLEQIVNAFVVFAAQAEDAAPQPLEHSEPRGILPAFQQVSSGCGIAFSQIGSLSIQRMGRRAGGRHAETSSPPHRSRTAR